jgi:hypothetical protein
MNVRQVGLMVTFMITVIRRRKSTTRAMFRPCRKRSIDIPDTVTILFKISKFVSNESCYEQVGIEG